MRARVRARLLAPCLLALLSGLVLSGTDTARADCGIAQVGAPARHVVPSLPPLAIGDSTMLFALPALTAEGFAVNARGCRQFPEALTLLAALAAAHQLPHLVVIALGANGSVTSGYVDAALAILGPSRMLALVTPRQSGGGAGPNATTVRELGAQYPTRVRVLDWVTFSAGQGTWFQPDGLHLTLAGAGAFARLLATALPLAAPPPPTITFTAAPTPGASVRIRLPHGWALLSRESHAALLSPPGLCDYRLAFAARLRATVKRSGPARQPAPAREVRALVPPGVATGQIGIAPRDAPRAAWMTWRERGTPMIGAVWVAPLPASRRILVLEVRSTVAAGCSIGAAHRLRAALFTLLGTGQHT